MLDIIEAPFFQSWMTFDQAHLVGLECQNTELNEQVMQLMHAVECLVVNQPQHTQLQPRRARHDVDNDYDDLGKDDDSDELHRASR